MKLAERILRYLVEPCDTPTEKKLSIALQLAVAALIYVEESKVRIPGFDTHAVFMFIARELGVSEDEK